MLARAHGHGKPILEHNRICHVICTLLLSVESLQVYNRYVLFRDEIEEEELLRANWFS